MKENKNEEKMDGEDENDETEIGGGDMSTGGTAEINREEESCSMEIANIEEENVGDTDADIKHSATVKRTGLHT